MEIKMCFFILAKYEKTYSDRSDDRPLAKLKQRMTKTQKNGKACFYLIVPKVWTMELLDRKRFFFPLQRTQMRMCPWQTLLGERKGVGAQKLHQERNRVLFKQWFISGLQYTINLCHCDSFCSGADCDSSEDEPLMDLLKRKPTRTRITMANRKKTHISGTFSLFNFRKVQIHIYKLNAYQKKKKPTSHLHLFYHICVSFPFCCHLYFVQGSS